MEAVAEALFVAQDRYQAPGGPHTWANCPERWRDHYRGLAIAAIAALAGGEGRVPSSTTDASQASGMNPNLPPKLKIVEGE